MTAKLALSNLPPARRLLDAVTRRIVAVGGGAVIATIALIFFYLVWVIAPIFNPASIAPDARLPLTGGKTMLIDVNESSELTLRIVADGRIEFINLRSGALTRTAQLNHVVRAARRVEPVSGVYALIDDNNRLGVFRTSYPISFDNGERRIDSHLTSEFDGSWLALGAFTDFDVYYENYLITVATINNRVLTLLEYADAETGFTLSEPVVRTVELDRSYNRVIIGSQRSWLFLIGDDGAVAVWDLRTSRTPTLIDTGQLTAEGSRLTAVSALLGSYSLLSADSSGEIAQWFLARTPSGRQLQKVRTFSAPADVTTLIPELRRKGFAAYSDDGLLSLYYTTSHQQLVQQQLEPGKPLAAVISPRADLLLIASDRDELRSYRLDNEHPEISWSALWSRVWYEGYEGPVHSWQSSSADNDFEEKFSLTPLLFGTLKAAFYAMLFAIPIAVMAALYTAFFMAPKMRRLVKPGIEIMAAFPTVVLGFLAGLWLAPLIELKLTAVLSTIILMPAAFITTSLLWRLLPDRLGSSLQGWQALLAIPIVGLTIAIAFTTAPAIESALFSGNLQSWLQNNHGINYDQRNALVVGIAMGLAVIPTIFSISEDAIYNVPNHLTHGSLALGATRWQTMTRVVLLTASPGIFSAVMIGLGRSLGETMIVLMATGNTAIMDWNIFEGMRTFAANIAVELPESEVGSSHYRILFLASLVLFLLTFILNSIAEVVRQQLRERYGNL